MIGKYLKCPHFLFIYLRKGILRNMFCPWWINNYKTASPISLSSVWLNKNNGKNTANEIGILINSLSVRTGTNCKIDMPTDQQRRFWDFNSFYSYIFFCFATFVLLRYFHRSVIATTFWRVNPMPSNQHLPVLSNSRGPRA